MAPILAESEDVEYVFDCGNFGAGDGEREEDLLGFVVEMLPAELAGLLDSD